MWKYTVSQGSDSRIASRGVLFMKLHTMRQIDAEQKQNDDPATGQTWSNKSI
jgi:hypothetical protein